MVKCNCCGCEVRIDGYELTDDDDKVICDDCASDIRDRYENDDEGEDR